MSARSKVVYLAWVLANCSAPRLPASPTPEDTPAGPIRPDGYPLEDHPCAGTGLACGQSDSGLALLRCGDSGVWSAVENCAEACAAKGRCSAGCAVTPDGASCLCAPGSSSCRQKLWCVNHYQAQERDGTYIDCVDVCREPGDAHFLEGCGAKTPNGDETCLCTSLGAPCDEAWGVEFCVGPALDSPPAIYLATTMIARCIGGVWTAESCADLCGDPLAQCQGHRTKEHACSCDNS